MKRLSRLCTPKATFIYAAAGRYCGLMFTSVLFIAFLLLVMRQGTNIITEQLLISGVVGVAVSVLIGWVADSSFIIKKGVLSWILGGSLTTAACLLIMFAEPLKKDITLSAITSVLWMVAYAVSDTAFWSLTASFGARHLLRESIASKARAAGVALAGILLIATIIALFFAPHANAHTVFKLGALFAALFIFLGAVLLFSRFGEPPVQGLLHCKEFVNILFKNDQLMSVTAVTILQQISIWLAMVGVSAAILHFQSSGELLLAFSIPAIVSQCLAYLIFARVTQIFNRRGMFIISAIIMITAFVLLSFEKPDDINHLGGVIAAFALANFGMGWSIASTTAMTADCVEYGEFKLRKRAPCVAFSMQTMARCIAPPAAFLIFAAGGRFGSLIYKSNDLDLLYPSYRFTIAIATFTAALMLISYLASFKLHGKMFENVLRNLEDGRDGRQNDAGYSANPLRYAINNQAVFCQLKADSPEQVMKLLIARLNQVQAINDPNLYLKEIERKIKKFPAGIADGIAIPHAIGTFVNRPAIAIATLETPLNFGAADGQDCDLVFMIASTNAQNAYISLLGQLSLVLNNKGFCDRLRKAVTAEEIIDRIKQCEKHLKY